MDVKMLLVVEHDVRRFFKYRWWLVGLISMNIADIAILAVVFNGMVTRIRYLDFVLPGIIVGALFASAFTMGREVNVEVRKRLHHYMLSLPIGRWEVVFGRVLAGGLRGLMYISPLLILLALYSTMVKGVAPDPAQTLLSIGVLGVLSMGISGLGIAIGGMTKSFDLHVTIRGVLYFLMLFCSTVFYPMQVLELLPEPIPTISAYNPVSYGADILRAVFGGRPVPPPYILYVTAYSAVLMVVGAAIYVYRIGSV